MIQYTLKCDQGHSFDSWFKSSAAFDSLKASGHVQCVTCGSSKVEKAIMAPRVRAARDTAASPSPSEGAQTPGHPAEVNLPVAVGPDPEIMRKLAELKKHVEANSDYVGDSFAREARAIHLGEAPERAIYGQANPAQAKALIEEGIPVMPLPFKPTKQTN